jgi:hypothetical protein
MVKRTRRRKSKRPGRSRRSSKSRISRKYRRSRRSRRYNSITAGARGIGKLFKRTWRSSKRSSSLATPATSATPATPQSRKQRPPTPAQIANTLFPILHKISIARDATEQNLSAANGRDNDLYEYINDSQNINHNIKTNFRNDKIVTERSYRNLLANLEAQIQTSHNLQYKYTRLQEIFNQLKKLNVYDPFAIYRVLTDNNFTTWNTIQKIPRLEDKIINCNTRDKKTQLIEDITNNIYQAPPEEASSKNCLKQCMDNCEKDK